MIDIGVNLTNRAFDDDREDVIERALAVGITHMVVTGTDLGASAAAVSLAATRPQLLSCTVGVHPHDAAGLPPDWIAQLRTLAAQPGVRALGEMGLDFNRNYTPRAEQEACFVAQLELAAELGLPVFVHERDTGGRVRELLDRLADELVDVVIHCFTGCRDDLEAYLERGWHIGITGWVCDERRGQPVAELLADVPAERLMIETDAPFLTPRNMPGHRRQRRNEPANLVWVARRIAELTSRTELEVGAAAAATARRFFRLT